MTTAAPIEEARLRERIRRATSAMREEVWTLHELRPLADLLDSFVEARRHVDLVGNVAWLADRRG
ncbi:hypothetical protein A5648_14110 [Mycolicibacter sinensis]|uniref:Uncharacterized protein n=1 Tax=Mycolicibacter sinensis (strain JDM601) TaxID=875328 RepID=A0A1A3UA43_MYCSD|nr:hypothetical protein A5648_14110 [Mycolicibacter sinensis]